MAQKVQDKSPEVAEMAKEWPRIEALLGGTAAMRNSGKAFLPKWPAEDEDSYQIRLSTATLFPAFARTVSVMGGKPFSKQLVLGEDVPVKMKAWCDDIDLQGNSLHTFASEVMSEALSFGLCGVLADYPKEGASARTVADERKMGVRPYAVLVRHGQILGWKAALIGGVMVLTQLRLAETKEVDDGDFGVKKEPRVRVLERGTWAVYMPPGERGGDWVIEESGTSTIQAIPFVPFYGKRLGFMRGESPLKDLAHLNVKHWQSQSDQDNILHVARVPVLAVIGADDTIGANGETVPWKLTVGASAAVRLPKGAEMKFVEHTGAAIAAGATSLEDLESQMVTTGAELLVIKAGEQKSATQANNDAEGNKSDLQRITEATEDGIDQVLQVMADWVSEPQGGHVQLFKDFGAAMLTDASAQLLLSLQQGGIISKATLIREQQRRGILSPDLDPQDELDAAQEDGPSLGTLGGEDE